MVKKVSWSELLLKEENQLPLVWAGGPAAGGPRATMQRPDEDEGSGHPDCRSEAAVIVSAGLYCENLIDGVECEAADDAG